MHSHERLLVLARYYTVVPATARVCRLLRSLIALVVFRFVFTSTICLYATISSEH